MPSAPLKPHQPRGQAPRQRGVSHVTASIWQCLLLCLFLLFGALPAIARHAYPTNQIINGEPIATLGDSPSLLGEYGNDGSLSPGNAEYIWLPTESGQAQLIGLYKEGRFYAVHTDHLGTPRLITNDANQVVWQWAYSAFGDNKPSGILQATQNPDSSATPAVLLQATAPQLTMNLRMAGQYFDEESGLFENGFRSYRPGMGAYSQFDPIGLEGGWNRYSYVGGDPLNGIDPEGLQVRQAPPSISYAGGLAAARMQMLLSQIRQYNPNYSYESIRPSTGPGSEYTNADVASLIGILRGYQNAQVCMRDNVPVGRFIADQGGNVMAEPVGGSTVSYGRSGVDTHTLFPNLSNFQRLNPRGHPNDPTPHAHGHQMGSGPGRAGQGPSLDANGNVVPSNSAAAHWPLN